MNIDEWIDECFSRLNTSPELLPAYQRFMLREIAKYFEENELNFCECMDSLIVLDEPESDTHAEHLESKANEFIGYFTESIKDGHLENYSEACAAIRVSDEYEPDVSLSAYEAIGALAQPWSMENPGYQDVLHACRAQGKDEEFANRCAKSLPDYDYFFKGAFEATVQFEKHITKAISEGRSVTFARAYAESWDEFAEVEEIAFSYAKCYEILTATGRETIEAKYLAEIYAKKHFDSDWISIDEDEDEDGQLYDHRLAQAEVEWRFKKLPDGLNSLREDFDQVYLRRAPSDYTKAWFDEIERLSRLVHAEELKVEDIDRSDWMEFLEEEYRLKEAAKPPRFDLMPDEALMAYPPRDLSEEDAIESEVHFREGCRENELDPTDPDERLKYQEILDEIRNYP